MNALRELITNHEKDLIGKIKKAAEDQIGPIEEYKRQLQGEQQKLIKEISGFMDVSQNKQITARRKAKIKIDDYVKETAVKLIQLRPKTRIKHQLTDFDKMKVKEEIGKQLEKIKLEKTPDHTNAQLEPKITAGKTQATLNLSGSNFNDQDMELMAKELEINKVCEQAFLSHPSELILKTSCDRTGSLDQIV